STGTWQAKIGGIRVNKYTTNEAVALHFSAASPVVEFYDVNAPDSEPFFTLKLASYGAFDINCGVGNSFFRSPSNTTSYGMGREAMNAGGWAFSYHMRLRDEDMAALVSGCDVRAEVLELVSSSGGDAYHEVLSHPEKYDRDTVIRAGDFFATSYSPPPFGDRQAVLWDPPAGEVLSLAALSQAPGSVGTDGDPDFAPLDRYFFSGLGSDSWNGAGMLANGRIRSAVRGATIAGSPSDADKLLLSGGWNLNTADSRVWAAVLRSLYTGDYKVVSPDGSTVTASLSAPVFAFPFAAGRPATTAASAAIVSGYLSAYDCDAHSPFADRKHPAYLAGVRDLGPFAEALAAEIASRIALRGKPFQSLSEFADSGLLDDAIDAVSGINLRSGDSDLIWKGAPAHVSGERLLLALSPILFTRSDTFTVRFYGRDETSGMEAVGEALVQRFPAATADRTEARRAFRVISMRWLARDEWQTGTR
ncbi:MAG TPA: hypothetical protein PKI32_05535, partial [Opitutales bacterium]|nr:hypothetical protein [Opitutales bacterium]